LLLPPTGKAINLMAPVSLAQGRSGAATMQRPAGGSAGTEGAMSRHFTTLILVGLVLGIAVGYACHEAFPDPKTAATIAGYISLVTDLFLRLIKMIIAPLVLSTLIVGIAHMGAGSSLGRIGLKTMGWFVGASLVSLLLGMVMVNILQPGVSLDLPIPDANTSPT
jgi:Na+/H+-dicarboxylate symporter